MTCTFFDRCLCELVYQGILMEGVLKSKSEFDIRYCILLQDIIIPSCNRNNLYK